MGWLDALRGFTMILVVSNHVALKSFGMQIRWSAALQFFLLFRMPLFFFISGTHHRVLPALSGDNSHDTFRG